MRGDQLTRQWRVLRQIEVSKTGLTAAEIAQATGVSLRTAYRDLDDLQFAGFPIYPEKGEGGNRWKFVDTYKLKVPFPLNYTELMSLHLSQDVFRVFEGTIFYESLESLFKKVKSTLPSQTLDFLEQIQSKFHISIKPYKDYRRFRKIIEKVNQATNDCRRVEMLYRPLRSKRDTHRKIDPLKIWLFEGTIYIIGFCHLRSEIRTFALDRIRLLDVMDETFQPPDDFDLNEYTKHSFKVMKDELYTVKVCIKPTWARYVGEKIWHESQKSCKLSDGSLELTFHVAGLDEIKQWVMGFGPEAYVLEPKKLKDVVVADLKKALVQYERLKRTYLEPPVLESVIGVSVKGE